MPGDESEKHFPVKLTQGQRVVVSEIAPELTERLNLANDTQRTIPFTLAELKTIKEKAGQAMQLTSTRTKRNSFRHVMDLTAKALDSSQGIGSIPASVRLYQIKITLKGIVPPIWRRIRVRDCKLNTLHTRIQQAMGWTNSHLYSFQIAEQRYGDPLLMAQSFEEMGYMDSTRTKLSSVVPKTGEPFVFEYEYDWGDCWRHEVVFEGCFQAETSQRYPVCLEGERNCPPENVGGTLGYTDFLNAISNANHKRHAELLHWIGGTFDPEKFDAAMVTKRMQRGL